MTQIPAEAYPVAVYGADSHLTPNKIRVEATETAFILWVDGLMIGVARDADDSRLQAAINITHYLSQGCQRFAALVRGDLEKRERDRAAEPTQAAVRVLQASRPAPYSQPCPPPPVDVLSALLTAAEPVETGVMPVVSTAAAPAVPAETAEMPGSGGGVA